MIELFIYKYESKKTVFLKLKPLPESQLKIIATNEDQAKRILNNLVKDPENWNLLNVRFYNKKVLQ